MKIIRERWRSLVFDFDGANLQERLGSNPQALIFMGTVGRSIIDESAEHMQCFFQILTVMKTWKVERNGNHTYVGITTVESWNNHS